MPSSCHAQVGTAMHSSYHVQSLPRTHPPLLSDAHLAASARHPNIARLALAREVLLEVNGCQKCSRHHLMNPRTIFSHSFEVELANARVREIKSTSRLECWRQRKLLNPSFTFFLCLPAYQNIQKAIFHKKIPRATVLCDVQF